MTVPKTALWQKAMHQCTHAYWPLMLMLRWKQHTLVFHQDCLFLLWFKIWKDSSSFKFTAFPPWFAFESIGLYLHSELLHLLHFSLWNNVFLSVSVMKPASPGDYAVNLWPYCLDMASFSNKKRKETYPLYMLLHHRGRIVRAVCGVRKYICVHSCDFN